MACEWLRANGLSGSALPIPWSSMAMSSGLPGLECKPAMILVPDGLPSVSLVSEPMTLVVMAPTRLLLAGTPLPPRRAKNCSLVGELKKPGALKTVALATWEPNRLAKAIARWPPRLCPVTSSLASGSWAKTECSSPVATASSILARPATRFPVKLCKPYSGKNLSVGKELCRSSTVMEYCGTRVPAGELTRSHQLYKAAIWS